MKNVGERNCKLSRNIYFSRMKLSIPFACLFLLNSFLAISQDDKKEWSKKLKETDPMTLKALYEERDNLKSQAESKDQLIASKDQAISGKDEKLAELTKQLEEVKANSVKMPVETGEKDITANGYDRQNANPEGVVFKVQIGAFKNKDLTKYFENNKNFSGDVDPDGTKKYTLGYFSDYWEADRFKKYLREMGVRDAWIVPYKAGKRLNIKDVLEGVVE